MKTSLPSGKMGLGQLPDPESKPLRLMINLFGFTFGTSGFELWARVAAAYVDKYQCSRVTQALVTGRHQPPVRRRRRIDYRRCFISRIFPCLRQLWR